MLTLLRKIFIKDYTNVKDPTVRQKHGILATILGLIINLITFAFKLLVGIFVHSISIISDAMNNLSDMGTSIVNLIGFKLSSKTPDKKHPFGYGRIEYISGLIVSFIIIIVAVVLGYTSITRIINNEVSDYTNNTYVIITFVILGVSIILKLVQGLIYRKMSKIIDSVLLKASSQDSFNDVISTTAVLIATTIEYILYRNGTIVNIDAWMGIAVSIFVLIAGIRLTFETSSPLIGNSPDHNLIKNITDDILKFEGVLGVHDMIFHSYGVNVTFVTCHVEIDSKDDFLKSHDLIDEIEKTISYKYRLVLTIHIDPLVTDNEEQNALKEKTKELLNAYNPVLKFHDFRFKYTDKGTLVEFDVVVPYEANIECEDILRYITDEYKKIDEKYIPSINFDNDFIG